MEGTVLFDEASYAERMEREVMPWLEKEVTTGTLETAPGIRIRYAYAVPPSPKAYITIFHGFCEFFGKYHELVYQLWQAGYGVFFHEHRGHGGSTHEAEPEDVVYIDSFDTYVSDCKRVYEEIVKPRSEAGKRFLFAHSMGGAIGALYLEQFPEDFERALLNAPMLEVRFGGFSEGVLHIVDAWMHLAHRQMHLAPTQHRFDPAYKTVDARYSQARWNYQHALRLQEKGNRTTGASLGWVFAAQNGMEKLQREASRVQTPTLLLCSEYDEMVLPGGQIMFAEQVPCAERTVLRDAPHEAFNGTQEVRERHFAAVSSFFSVNSGA